MSRITLKSWLTCPALIGVSLLVSSTAYAGEAVEGVEASVEKGTETLIAQVATPDSTQESQILDRVETYSREGESNSYDQVTNVNQLRDVSPTDWAYEALRSLVERYGCIVGYPNQTYRGNQALSRYEFAAGLNACLNQIERLIASSEAVTREDIETLQRLVQEFEAELATLSGRVDNLEGRTAFLEDHQFSTTTKLAGEVIFALTDSFGDNGDTNTVFGDRFRLALNTSFTGEDNLVTRLSGGNLTQLFGPTTTQTFNVGENSNNVDVDWLAYYFPIKLSEDSQLSTYVAGFGGIHSDYVPTLSPYFQDFDGGNGALSTFASESPIYRVGGGSGIGVSYQLGFLESVVGPSTITAGYLAGNGGIAENTQIPKETLNLLDPTDTRSNGLFNGDYAALAQINFAPFESLNIGLTYVRGYQQVGTPTFGTSSNDSESPGFAYVGTEIANAADSTKTTDTYGTQIAWAINDNFSLSGFFAYQNLNSRDGGPDGDVWTYGAGLAMPDLGKEGSVLGIFAGVQPYLGDAADNDLPIHIEGFYKYQINDNISVTPGVIYIDSPNQGADDGSEVIGTLRTTFTF
jgi:hypothetical protein